jgi:hypothetical protein
MRRQRFVLLLVAALVVIAGGLWLSARRQASQETQGTALLPGLGKDVNAVTSVQIVKGDRKPAVTLQSTPSGWVVAQRADYPADVTKIRTLLLALRDAKIVEIKTANPALFNVIGVDDPVKPDSAGTEVTVSPGGQAIIVGKAVGQGNFVRRAGENQAYSVEPSIAVDADPRHWISPRLLDLKSALIQSVQFKPADASQPGDAAQGAAAQGRARAAATGLGYTLRRSNPADDSFTLQDVPAGRKALDPHALAPGPTTFTGVDAEDVAPESGIDFTHPAQVIVTLTGDDVLTLDGVVVGDKHWITVHEPKDAALTARTQGRAFEIASYRYDAIFKPLEQLLEPKPAPAAPATAKPGAPGGAAGKRASLPHSSSAAPPATP